MLKGFWKRHRKSSLPFKLRSLFWELRYAWQRAWRGYDFTDIMDLNRNFVDRIILILKDFKEKNMGLFMNLDCNELYDLDDPKLWHTKEETDKIIDDMIYYFENSNADKFIDVLYGAFDEKTGKFESKPTIEQIMECDRKAQSNQDKAFELFVKYFDCLWY